MTKIFFTGIRAASDYLSTRRVEKRDAAFAGITSAERYALRAEMTASVVVDCHSDWDALI
jgi:hypothetical protein